jgi:hypothetical protein
VFTTFEHIYRVSRLEGWSMRNGKTPTIGWLKGYLDGYYGSRNNPYPKDTIAWMDWQEGNLESIIDNNASRNPLWDK